LNPIDLVTELAAESIQGSKSIESIEVMVESIGLAPEFNEPAAKSTKALNPLI